jgi:ketosteroid isomerase-like protein
MATSGEVLKNFYAAVANHDVASARAYLHGDMVFVGLFQTYGNAEEYIAALTGLLSITTRLTVKKIVTEGDHAAVFFELVTTAPAAATTLVAELHEVKNGKIAYAQSAFDGRPFAVMFGAA